jgi:hypothetical protein
MSVSMWGLMVEGAPVAHPTGCAYRFVKFLSVTLDVGGMLGVSLQMSRFLLVRRLER